MICEQWREKLDAYVDDPSGLHRQDEFAGLEEHIRSCSGCAAEMLNRMQLKRATRAAALRYEPSASFRQRVEKSIQVERKPAWAWTWIPTLAGAVALILLTAVSATVWVRHAAHEAAVAQLVDLHVATLASSNPVDVVSTDRHTVKPWFQGKLPFTFNLPELQGSPYKLLGGKLVYFHHSPSAQLLFELHKHELSLFIAQESQQTAFSGPGQSDVREKGFSMESWSQDGLRYIIVSDAGPSDVRELGALFKSAAKQ
ncbi:MAG: anti-sigma factor family protein [Terracidiphilus sp.]